MCRLIQHQGMVRGKRMRLNQNIDVDIGIFYRDGEVNVEMRLIGDE